MLTKLSKQITNVYIKNMIIVSSIILLSLALIFHWVNELYLLAAAISGLIFLLMVKFIENHKILNTSRYLQNFSHIPEAGTFEETMPAFSKGTEKLPHLVLLIHGFSASTSEFRYLLPELEKSGIPYYVPTLSGFGLDNVQKLRNIQPQDWLRDARAAYEIASQVADKVSIVAHSMGAMLALYLCSQKPVHHVILTSPYVMVKNHHRFMKQLLLSPVISKIIALISPTVKKNSKTDLEQILSSGRFVYTAVPTESIRSLWLLQQYTETMIATNKELFLFVGMNDQTIEVDTIIEQFSSKSVTHVKKWFNSGHNLLEEAERVEVIREILDILKS